MAASAGSVGMVMLPCSCCWVVQGCDELTTLQRVVFAYPGVRRRAQAGGRQPARVGGGVFANLPTCRLFDFPACWLVGKLAGCGRGAGGRTASAGRGLVVGSGTFSRDRRWSPAGGWGAAVSWFTPG